MYALLTGTPPFECSTVQDTLVKIKSGKFTLPPGVSESACDLIQNLLVQDPKIRMLVTDVLEHKFLNQSVTADELKTDSLMVLDDLKSEAYVTLDPTKAAKFEVIADTPAFRNALKRSNN